MDTETSNLQIITQFTGMHYHFVIWYITHGCWLCYHRHVARFWALITGTLVSQSHSYFTSGGLQQISSSWRQPPWDSRPGISFFNWILSFHSPYVTSCSTRGWVCSLQLLLAPSSAVILRSDFHRTRDHILLSQIRDFPNLEGQVPVFISPSIRMAQLYPEALGSFFIASCVSTWEFALLLAHRLSIYSFVADWQENSSMTVVYVHSCWGIGCVLTWWSGIVAWCYLAVDASVRFLQDSDLDIKSQ
jgi:hypothetical protein